MNRLGEAISYANRYAGQLPPKGTTARQNTLYILERKPLVKIGITNDLERRIGELERAAGLPIERWWAVRMKEPARLEARLKRLWRAEKALGEWYRLEFEAAVAQAGGRLG